MQDADAGHWITDFPMSDELRCSVRELNHRFLDLVSGPPDGWSVSNCGPAVAAHIAPLSAAQRAMASDCPYALFDLRFHDDRHWRRRLSAAGSWNVEEPTENANVLEFCRLALFFAWHLASLNRRAALLIFGMRDVTSAALRAATIDSIPGLAAAEVPHLTARWKDCLPYWSALTGAATQPDLADLRRIQLFGLQLAAAASLA